MQFLFWSINDMCMLIKFENIHFHISNRHGLYLRFLGPLPELYIFIYKIVVFITII